VTTPRAGTPVDDVLVHRRVLAAPRELVWRCLTEPAELARFWGPRGMDTPVDGIVVELRPGGRFETLMVGPPGSYRMVAEFTEVVPPERLAWVEPGSGLRTTGVLTEVPGGTELVITQRDVPAAMRTPENRAGFATSLDKLAEHLVARQVAETYAGLADLAGDHWTAPSLCAGWQVRHVVAHVTMPVRLTPERFGAELAAAGGDFGRLSDAVAERDGELPPAQLLAQLRSPALPRWLPPGGGAPGALRHAVIHSLDVTLAVGRPPVAPAGAVAAVLADLAGHDWFGTGPLPRRPGEPDADLLARLAGRTPPT
jgi:uncharacterized protein (TIGR03083 family)